MNEELAQLLEAESAGTLDAAGRARLDALCAADPAAARQIAAERRLTRMLGQHGPNRAPAGLAARVFAELDKPAADPPPARRFNPFALPPTLRWGLGFAVVALIAVEAGILLRMRDAGRGPLAPSSEPNSAREVAIHIPTSDELAREAAQPARGQRSAARQATNAKPARATADDARRKSEADDAVGEELDQVRQPAAVADASAGAPAPRLADVATVAAPEAAVSGQEHAVAPTESVELAAARPEPTPTPAPQQAATEPAPPTAEPPAAEVAVADAVAVPVTMEIKLAAAAHVAPGATRVMRSGAFESAAAMLNEGQRAARRGTMQPAQPNPAAFGPATNAAPRGEFAAYEADAPGLREIEIAIVTVEGEILEREPIAGSSDWRIKARFTGEQLGAFQRELERLGILGEQRQSSSGGSTYLLQQGDQLLDAPDQAAGFNPAQPAEVELTVRQGR